ncbi:MAG: DUF1800 domain-containing protein, partial [Pseudomonadota bacterium]|nr:DUF1800 domain-containing protein [Pseudomonadota bacterium]
PSQAEASRFLAQATFGPSGKEIQRLSAMSYAAWLDEQFAKPQMLHRLYINQAAADLDALGQRLTRTNFFDSYWSQAIGAEDQLRQRAAFALSEVMVISFAEAALANQTRGVASYYDMLGENAFGNFRKLLEDVTLHPMMGLYLTWLGNQKEDPATGKVPDLNFAREITQLFSIGEWKLNADGSNVLGADGKPVPAYSGADLSGMSQVFTGWSWYAGPNLSDRTSRRFFGNDANLERDWRPMQAYNEYTPNTSFHSVSAKSFLGVTIAAQTKSDSEGDLKIVLDTLFNHPNVGPFIGKQLIQRLVTSNPSPAYVARVTAAFNDNGSGVRGDMKALWRAILLDPEARLTNPSNAFGKVREPVVRLGNYMRAFNATSTSGRYSGIGLTDDPATSLNQTPMFAPTVFNFFRPGYVPTSKLITDANLVVPELQITHDLSVAGYMNYMRNIVAVDKTRDIQQDYSTEKALANDPAALVDRIDLLLLGGRMPVALKTQLVAAVTSRALPAPVYPVVAPGGGASAPAGGGGSAPAASASAPAAMATNQAAIDSALLDRVCIAIYLAMASPDYLIQK